MRWQNFALLLSVLAGLSVLSSCGGGTAAATPTISVFGAAGSANAGGPTVQFTATVENLSSTLVTWQVNSVTSGNAQYGTIDTNGVYTPPATQPTNDVVTITAIAQAQTSLTGTATITILAPAAITGIAPNPATPVAASGTETFTATVAGGNSSTIVNWYVSAAPVCTATAYQGVLGGNTTVGTISTSGLTANYVAPVVPPAGGTVTIYAVSQGSSQLFYCVPLQVTFGPASLQGSYAFSTSGRVVSTNGFFARAGSFTASCTNLCAQGTLTGGIEDTNQAGVVTQQTPFSGTYTVGPDGRGTMQFCEGVTTTCTSGAATAFFRIVVFSTQQAQMIEFSQPGSSNALIASGGEMDLQTQSIFSAGKSNLTGSYSFNFAGVSAGSTFESAVGEFTANGNGNILAGVPNSTPGAMDINPGGTQTLGASSYTVSTNGRGTATIGSLNFSFYLISASRAKFIEIDPSPGSILVGDAFKQQTTLTCAWGVNSLSGSALIFTSGSSLGAGIVDVGSFTATGGSISAASIDENNGGVVSSQLGTLNGGYAVDPCGRGTMTIGGHSYVFYPISPSNFAVVLETTTGVSAHGFLNLPQGGPFVNSTLTGSYGLSLAGVNASGASGLREDIVGQLAANGTGNVTAGSLDINNFGATQTGVQNLGTYLPTAGFTLRATMNLSPTRSLVLYGLSPTQFYVLDTDPTSVAGGSLYNQF
jgi:hypothetical protein